MPKIMFILCAARQVISLQIALPLQKTLISNLPCSNSYQTIYLFEPFIQRQVLSFITHPCIWRSLQLNSQTVSIMQCQSLHLTIQKLLLRLPLLLTHHLKGNKSYILIWSIYWQGEISQMLHINVQWTYMKIFHW